MRSRPARATSNDDGTVDVNDLILLFEEWGPEGCGGCPQDFYPVPCGNDGLVDVNELLAMMAAWGPCDDPGSESMPESVNDCFQTCEGLEDEHWSECMDACIAYLCAREYIECDE